MWSGGVGVNQYGLGPVSVREDLRQENNTLVIWKVILTASRKGLWLEVGVWWGKYRRRPGEVRAHTKNVMVRE